MEVNKEEALRCLNIAQKHRSSSNLPSALKFAKKSVSLYSTPEGNAFVTILEREISTGGGPSTPAPADTGANGTSKAGARTSGVEEHVTSARSRTGHHEEKPKKREYTVKQMEVVKRVKGCQHHQYYEILALEKSCSENDVKKAYRKLALALHPDKNGAPGADEAFKMVSKAFQILSEADLRAAFDSNPTADPTSRNSGMSSRGGGGGGMRPGFGGGGYQADINPEDLFNMFFGGGGGGGSPFGGGQANIFTFGGPGGFQTTYARPRRANTAQANQNENTSPIVALLPILVLFLFAAISVIPTLFGETPTPDPAWSFEPASNLHTERHTFHRGISYWVDKDEWDKHSLWQSVPDDRKGGKDAAMWSTKMRSFERSLENTYIRRLENDCEYQEPVRNQAIQREAGLFGIGANYKKIKELRAEVIPSCQQLRQWGLLRKQQQNLW